MKSNTKQFQLRMHSGFTLIELMVTLAVLGILVTVVVPQFNSTMQRSELSAQSGNFVSAMRYARNEAVRRNSSVQITAATTDTTSIPGKNIWTTEIQIKEPGGITMRSYGLSTGISIISDNNATTYTFDSSGILTTSGDSVKICDETRIGEIGRDISIKISGHVSTELYTCS